MLPLLSTKQWPASFFSLGRAATNYSRVLRTPHPRRSDSRSTIQYFLLPFPDYRYIRDMKSVAHIFFSFCYLSLTLGLPVSTNSCWEKSAPGNCTAVTLERTSCCSEAECAITCCMAETRDGLLGADHTSAKTWRAADQKDLSTVSHLESRTGLDVVARLEDQAASAPPRDSLIQILHCSFLL